MKNVCGAEIMSKFEIRIGDYDHITKTFDLGVFVTIDGDHALAKEVMEYLEGFESDDTTVVG